MTKGDVVLLRNDPKDIVNLKYILGIHQDTVVLSELPLSCYFHIPSVTVSVSDVVDPTDYGINVWKK